MSGELTIVAADLAANSKFFSDELYARCKEDPQWSYDTILWLRQKLASAMLATDTVSSNLQSQLDEIYDRLIE